METKSVAIEARPEPTGVAGWPAAIKNYYEDVTAEMRRVTWPNEQQVKATTVVVIASVFAFAAYFFIVDFVIGRLITQIFKSLAK